MALNYFDELLKKVTREELDAIDEFIAENNSFTVYTNLSRHVAQPSSLQQKPVSAEDNFQRSGLKWVMGLARVEYASILAAFTTTIDPFVVVTPSEFEMPAYKSLLMDGVRMHYWSLARDPAVRKVTSTSPRNPVVLSYSRRLGLARKMLSASAKAGIGEMSPGQYRELAGWKRDLDELHAGLLTIINGYMMAQRFSKTTMHNEGESDFVQACGAMLRGERMELRRGTAKVIKYPKTQPTAAAP